MVTYDIRRSTNSEVIPVEDISVIYDSLAEGEWSFRLSRSDVKRQFRCFCFAVHSVNRQVLPLGGSIRPLPFWKMVTNALVSLVLFRTNLFSSEAHRKKNDIVWNYLKTKVPTC